MPPDAAGLELFVNYVPAFRGVNGWERVYRRDRGAVDQNIVRRVIMENTANRHERVLVDITEAGSASDASAVLRSVQAESNVTLVPGPSSLGPGALQYPETTPSLMNFHRANLSVWVFSCGKDPVEIQPWVDRVVADLNAPTAASYDRALIFDRVPDHSPAIQLKYSLKWTLGEWGWFKFQAQNANVRRGAAADRLLITPTGHAPVVHGWAQEPGRETYQGQFP